MSAYFDRLEQELRQAVVLEASRRRRRTWIRELGLAAGTLAAVGVAVLAFALAGHRSPAGQVPARPATLRALIADYAILRRPQTPADRTSPLAFEHLGTFVPGLVRLARTLPDGTQVFLGVVRRGPAAPEIAAWINASGGGAGVLSRGNLPEALRLRPAAGSRLWLPTWVSAVPDGVASVRWTFIDPVHHEPLFTIAEPVRDNVAAADIPGSTVADLVDVRWLDGRGHTVRAAGPTAMRTGALHVLSADAIARVRFGVSRAAVAGAVDRLVHASGRVAPKAATCDLDGAITWPSAGLTVYLKRDRFAGYAVGAAASRRLRLATMSALRVGDPLWAARELYDDGGFAGSAAQGGVWIARTAQGPIDGFVVGGRVASIDAGDVGCPALSP